MSMWLLYIKMATIYLFFISIQLKKNYQVFSREIKFIFCIGNFFTKALLFQIVRPET